MKYGVYLRKFLKVSFCLGFIFILVTCIMVLKEFHHFSRGKWKSSFIFSSFDNKLGDDHLNTSIKLENESYQVHRQKIFFNSSSCFGDKFIDILLIIGFGDVSEFESLPLFELLYKTAFPNRVYCSPSLLQNNNDIVMLKVNTGRGAFLYDCFTTALKEYEPMNYTGYFFVGENVLLNFWRMTDFDSTKIWEDVKIRAGPLLYEQNKDIWEWWQSPWGLRAMEKVYEYFIELNYYDNRKAKLMQGDWKPEWDAGQALNTWLWNSKGEFSAYWSNRSIFYLPRAYTKGFIKLAKHFRASGVRHSIALSSISRLLTLNKHTVQMSSTDIEEKDQDKYLNERDELVSASINTDFIYISGSPKVRRQFLNHLRLKEYAVGKFLKYKKC